MVAVLPRHVACVMDGNGRWAERKGLTRTEGHRVAEGSVIDVIETSHACGVEWLTLYAFSTENWTRPDDEVAFLMRLVQRTLRKHAPSLHLRGIRCRFLGGDDRRIPSSLARDIAEIVELTSGNTRMTLTVAFDHGGRDAIVRAARALVRDGVPEEAVTEEALAAKFQYPDTPDVDLVIRTSGEQRVSNFMLWQVAYAEWMFPPTLWPDFRAAEYRACLEEYRRRKRRYGGLGRFDAMEMI
ncbi:Trans,polycis-polyprenyl diphosphate synthase ((2Z,6E)-farnesyl diphosphate specific) [Actinomadura rubteroloni]|uniref:Isoprenyl transferase n=1 Tax=Actinomadura rubteroloni TaxID=1926885 RepID=A0A2P4UEM1_9ACTN|nr:polyprenyl diphosphate synthase [Actinomadura rubteroloni]POM23510.1 Trans,polycis-polyprenyl diphosphate synthase ((2Z,6E)-farnesyl diphosphate specific) [Actinomadura rubteroloni]